MSSEREEMAMSTVLSTQLLYQTMIREFDDRLRNNLHVLKQQPCYVRVNQVV